MILPYFWYVLMIAFVFITLFAVLTIEFVKKRAKEFVEREGKNGNLIKYSKNAYCFGVASKGAFQVKGYGVLYLDNKHLTFKYFLPFLKKVIPVVSIEDIELVKNFLGKKTVNRFILKIDFNENNQKDSIGFLVKAPEEWKTEIEKIKKQKAG